jgi:hypothetical protein
MWQRVAHQCNCALWNGICSVFVPCVAQLAWLSMTRMCRQDGIAVAGWFGPINELEARIRSGARTEASLAGRQSITMMRDDVQFG